MWVTGWKTIIVQSGGEDSFNSNAVFKLLISPVEIYPSCCFGHKLSTLTFREISPKHGQFKNFTYTAFVIKSMFTKLGSTVVDRNDTFSFCPVLIRLNLSSRFLIARILRQYGNDTNDSGGMQPYRAIPHEFSPVPQGQYRKYWVVWLLRQWLIQWLIHQPGPCLLWLHWKGTKEPLGAADATLNKVLKSSTCISVPVLTVSQNSIWETPFYIFP